MALAAGVARRLPAAEALKMNGSASGRAFERAVEVFIEESLPIFPDPVVGRMKVEPGRYISDFAQYAHLDEIQAAVRRNPELEATLGGDYLVKPDLVISWDPLTGEEVIPVIGTARGTWPTLSPVTTESPGGGLPILHASVSCKWTIRSDRVQNTRTEALNLVRNRKGRTPHIVAVTMEPLPNRIAAIAIGTGDIDCVYHAALHELRAAAAEIAESDPGVADRLEMMVSSRRLRDIADLPLDLLA